MQETVTRCVMAADQEARYLRMLQASGEELRLRVERESIQPGRSFSEEAMNTLGLDMMTWVGTRLKRRWDQTGEPPTLLTVTLRVEVA